MLERGNQFFDLGFAEFERAGDFRLRRAVVTIPQRFELRSDDGQQQPVILDQQLDEIAGGCGSSALIRPENSSMRCLSPRRGSAIASRTSGLAATCDSWPTRSAQAGKPALSSRAAANSASAYGRATVESSAMTVPD